jgi:HSP20 family molecular chaperone IbpA
LGKGGIIMFSEKKIRGIMNELDNVFCNLQNSGQSHVPYKLGTGTSSGGQISTSPFTFGYPQIQPLAFKTLIDIKEDGEFIIVTADLPGADKENIKVRLENPRLLELVCEQKVDYEDKKENYYVRERSYGCIKRSISLPSDVTEIDAKLSFKNGVLEMRFNKIKIKEKEYLKLE